MAIPRGVKWALSIKAQFGRRGGHPPRGLFLGSGASPIEAFAQRQGGSN
jgi:hypothetical protein